MVEVGCDGNHRAIRNGVTNLACHKMLHLGRLGAWMEE